MSQRDDDDIRDDDGATPPPPPENDEREELEGERGMPSVNRPSAGKSFGKSIGMMVLGVLALVVLAVAFIPHHKKPETNTTDSQVMNHLPKLQAFNETSTPAPAVAQSAPAPAVAKQQGSQHQGPTPEQQMMQRRQRAPIIAYGSKGQGSTDAGNQGNGNAQGSAPQGITANYGPGVGQAPLHPGQEGRSGGLAGASGGGSGLGGLLKPTSTPMAYASLLPDRNFLITKGTFIDCALETAIDTSVAGFTSCRVTRNVYSDNGRVLLIERGSRITGQYQTEAVKPGVNRIFVLWDRVETPNGVVVNLDSPGIGPLGRSGLKAHVNNHFFQRFGAALMLSMIEDYAQYQVAKQQNSTSVQFGGTTNEASQLAAIALQNSINIKPTLYKNQGDHVKVYVARDIDFATVYGLETIHQPTQVISTGNAGR